MLFSYLTDCQTHYNKMELDELVKILIFFVVLVIMMGAVVFLLYGKGGNILDYIGNIWRFGR